MSGELSRALDQINNTSKEANKLNDQLGRETNVLEERKYVSSNHTMWLVCVNIQQMFYTVQHNKLYLHIGTTILTSLT